MNPRDALELVGLLVILGAMIAVGARLTESVRRRIERIT